jgi:hypothetical protein
VLHRRHRLSSALAIGALALGTSALAGATTQGASAAPGDSPIRLWTPSKVVTYSYGGRVYTDYGVKVVAPDNAFEVRSVRPSYSDEIESTWTSGALNGSLPAGSTDDWNSGLQKFARVVVRDLDGNVVKRFSQDACLGGYSQRVEPDAPATSPYPYSCPWNPYTLGSVMGLQRGHASSISGDQYGYRSSRLAPGRYDVTARILPAYAQAIGISAEDALRTTRLVVKKGSDDGEFRPQRQRHGSTTLQPAAHRPVGPSAVPPAGQPAPDLRSLPAWGITLNSKGTLLRFAATVWNGGTSPLVVDGFRGDHADHMDAYQYFFDTDGDQTGYQPVGEMHWHAGNHNHWHFEDFARYRLLNQDMTQAVKSRKQSFCLANTDAVDYTLPGSDWQPDNTDLSTACGGFDALSIREVLSAGSGDTYAQYRYGQAFPIKNVPNGVYYVAVEANPKGNLYELDESNNDSLRRIKLYGTPDHRKVKVSQVGIIDESRFGFFRQR